MIFPLKRRAERGKKEEKAPADSSQIMKLLLFEAQQKEKSKIKKKGEVVVDAEDHMPPSDEKGENERKEEKEE